MGLAPFLADGTAAAQRKVLFQGRGRNGQRHNDGRNQLQALAGNIGTQGQRNDKAEDHAARHSRSRFDSHTAAAKQRFANNQRSQTDDHHASAQVDIGGFLVLSQNRAGK